MSEILTLGEWIESKGITMTAKVDEITYTPEPGKPGVVFARTKWDITLSCEGRTMGVEWTGPSGEAWRFGNDRYCKPNQHRKRSDYYNDVGLKTFVPEIPPIERVIESLITDCQTVEFARDFNDFADNYGYDRDSYKAREIYRACEQEAHDLKNLIGRPAYRNLVMEED